LFTDRISIFTTAVYILFILLFGYYYRRFHWNRAVTGSIRLFHHFGMLIPEPVSIN
jgi:hypothetical protein